MEILDLECGLKGVVGVTCSTRRERFGNAVDEGGGSGHVEVERVNEDDDKEEEDRGVQDTNKQVRRIVEVMDEDGVGDVVDFMGAWFVCVPISLFVGSSSSGSQG